MADFPKLDWFKLPSLVFCEIMQKVGDESLEDLANCRLVCKTWNDQIKSNKIWKKKLVKLKKSWDEGEPREGKTIINFDQEIPGGAKNAVNGEMYVTDCLNYLSVFRCENIEKKWRINFHEKERVEQVRVTKDVIALSVMLRLDPWSPNNPRKLDVYDIRTQSKLMSYKLKLKDDFLADGSQIILYKANTLLCTSMSKCGVLTNFKVIDVYNQGDSFTYKPKKFNLNGFLSFENSKTMSFYNSHHIPSNAKVTILEVRTQDRKVLRKHVINLRLETDYPILGGFFTEPKCVLLQQNHITVFNLGGEVVRLIALNGELKRRPRWYHAHGRLIVTNKEDTPWHLVHLWKIEDLISTNGVPRQFKYDLEMEDLGPNDYEDGEEGYLEEFLQPVINRESIRIHIWYPGTKKVKWVTMKF